MKLGKHPASIKVAYPGPLDSKRDDEILDRMRTQGYQWYASGFDFVTNMREHCFDVPGVVK